MTVLCLCLYLPFIQVHKVKALFDLVPNLDKNIVSFYLMKSYGKILCILFYIYFQVVLCDLSVNTVKAPYTIEATDVKR